MRFLPNFLLRLFASGDVFVQRPAANVPRLHAEFLRRQVGIADVRNGEVCCRYNAKTLAGIPAGLPILPFRNIQCECGVAVGSEINQLPTSARWREILAPLSG